MLWERGCQSRTPQKTEAELDDLVSSTGLIKREGADQNEGMDDSQLC